uniref:Uncharacterized protein n=1 Tax=Magallana gigas TaxID=29159 RepID=A0A8W8JWT3_MAGGI|nr:uncharacterized protein LOC105329583 isoform X1 [Crassostrea gigas]
MKRERSDSRKHESESKRRCIETSTNECQWYEVLLELHMKSSQQPSFASFRHGWKEHVNDWYRLTGAINKSEDRRELPTIPQPTHTIEWLARTNFKHRPLRRHDIPQPRNHKVPKRHVQTDDLNKSFYVY